MEALIIGGGKPLRGTVKISGSKNAALPIMAATALCGAEYVLRGCPDISDVRCAAEILQALGGKVTCEGGVLNIDTRPLCRWKVPGTLMRRMRASVLFLGPLLARFGRAEITLPGGCPLGSRPVDLHLQAMAQMGASVVLTQDRICCHAPRLRGCGITLRYPSVGATENALMAAVACCGETVIDRAAREPEIGDLIAFLQAMGAGICGAGTRKLSVYGGRPLHGAEHTVMPDRMEAATYLCAAAGCGGDVVLEGADGACLQPLIGLLRQAGCEILQMPAKLRVRCFDRLRGVGFVETAPYPGFPTDAQAPLMAALLRARGETRFRETVFDGRFGHVPQLRRFGARIEQCGAEATVCGVEHLAPAWAQACDLRAAAALLLAALQAEGESRIFGLKHLYRGYDRPVEKLTSLGAAIGCVQ